MYYKKTEISKVNLEDLKDDTLYHYFYSNEVLTDAESYGLGRQIKKSGYVSHVVVPIKEVADVKEYKKVIMDLLDIYVINLNEKGYPKASVNEIMEVLNRARDLNASKEFIAEMCVCKNRQDQYFTHTWICGDCEKEIKQNK